VWRAARRDRRGRRWTLLADGPSEGAHPAPTQNLMRRLTIQLRTEGSAVRNYFFKSFRSKPRAHGRAFRPNRPAATKKNFTVNCALTSRQIPVESPNGRATAIDFLHADSSGPLLWLDITTCVVELDFMFDLRSKARRRLLAYYFTNPTARLHLRDLAERLSIDPSNLSRELKRLEREGLFRSEVSGRQKYFQLNREYPLFAEVRGIVTKTIGAIPLIAQSLKKIGGIEEAYLYGSFARNQQDATSDIDVLVIGSPRGEILAESVRKLERQLGREISYTVLTRKEFDSRRSRKDAFLENVWHNKRVSLIDLHEKAQTAQR
jgi:predicted nucleotidyltransferase